MVAVFAHGTPAPAIGSCGRVLGLEGGPLMRLTERLLAATSITIIAALVIPALLELLN